MSRKSNKNVSGVIGSSMSVANPSATQDTNISSKIGSQDVTISLFATPEGPMLSQEKSEFFKNQAVEYKRKYLLEEKKNTKEKEKKSKKREENNKKFNSRLSSSSAEEIPNENYRRSTRSSEKIVSKQGNPLLGQGTKAFSEESAGPSSREGIKNIKNNKDKKNRLSLARKAGAVYRTGPLPGPGKPGYPPILFSDVVKCKEPVKAIKKTPGMEKVRVTNVGNFSFKAFEERSATVSMDNKDKEEEKVEVPNQRQACESGLGCSVPESGSDKSVNTLELKKTNVNKSSGKGKNKDIVGLNFFSPSARSSPAKDQAGNPSSVEVPMQVSPIKSANTSGVPEDRNKTKDSSVNEVVKQVENVFLTEPEELVKVTTTETIMGEKSKNPEKENEKGEKSKNSKVDDVMVVDEIEEKMVKIDEESKNQMVRMSRLSKKKITSFEKEFNTGSQVEKYEDDRENLAVPKRGGAAAFVIELDLNESIMANQFNMLMDLENVDEDLAEAERNRRGSNSFITRT